MKQQEIESKPETIKNEKPVTTKFKIQSDKEYEKEKKKAAKLKEQEQQQKLDAEKKRTKHVASHIPKKPEPKKKDPSVPKVKKDAAPTKKEINLQQSPKVNSKKEKEKEANSKMKKSMQEFLKLQEENKKGAAERSLRRKQRKEKALAES